MTRQSSNNEPKDGFDLIEYPCDYVFKAMCKAVVDQSMSEQVRDLVLTTVALENLLEVRSTSSRTGKFESVTITVRILDRSQLESVYRVIADSPIVIMTL